MNIADGPDASRSNWMRGWRLVVLSFGLLIAGLFNNPPWKGYPRARNVELGTEPIRVADSLRRYGHFSDPFATPTGPTAHVAPGLPFLQSLILRSLGDGRNGWLALRLLPALAMSLQLALLPWLATRLGYPTSVGVLASIFGLIVKPGLEEQWEAHVAGLAAVLLTASACIHVTKGKRSAGRAAAVGALAGMAVYLNPALGFVYLAWFLYIGRGRNLLRRQVLPLWLVPLLLMAPWAVRNAAVLGGFFPVRDNLGLELYVSYNDCAPYGFRESILRSCIQRFHPNSNVDEALAVRALGEYNYNQDRLRRAVLWIRLHPTKAAELTAQRIWYFWFPSESGLGGYARQRIRMLALHALTLASFFGVYGAFRRRLESDIFLLLWVAIFPLIYYLVQFDYRYRYPILWVTWLLAADGVLHAGAGFGHKFSLPRGVVQAE